MSKIKQLRAITKAVKGAEMDCVVHSVTRQGDHGFAVVTITAARNDETVWTSGRLSIRLDTVDGVRPRPTSRNVAFDRVLGLLSIALGGAAESLWYWIDSSAHYWTKDNAPELYGAP